ncbi:MAG TPA: alpha/beta hydrolase [Chthoniobacterales bacterium]|nr:alpha/beta hydrolase [Chthoniobacterales bacterium]
MALAVSAGGTSAQQTTPVAGSALPFIDSKDQAIPVVGKFVTIFGVKIHYVDVGAGPTVILLHGLADDLGVWQSIIQTLAAKHRVIALDQVGFGRSDKPLLCYQANTFVDFLDGFLNELKIDRASLVGNSLGGWIAAAFELEHPERVERLILSDAAGYAALAKTMNPRALSALRLASREDIRYLGPLTFHDKRFYEDVGLAFKQRVTAGDSYTVSQLLDSMIRGEDVLDGRLGAIEKPTLIVWGHEDKLIPLSFGERFHKEIAGSKLRVIDNCGHMPHVECPKDFATAVLEFLSDLK